MQRSLTETSIQTHCLKTGAGICKDVEYPTNVLHAHFNIYSNPGNFRIRKFLDFMKINSLLNNSPGLRCAVKRSQL